jgi:hypothetical protein
MLNKLLDIYSEDFQDLQRYVFEKFNNKYYLKVEENVLKLKQPEENARRFKDSDLNNRSSKFFLNHDRYITNPLNPFKLDDECPLFIYRYLKNNGFDNCL